MREIDLGPEVLSGTPKDDPRVVLANAMGQQGANKIYRTFWQLDDGTLVTLATTSGDVHRGIGMVTREGLDALCTIIELEHRQHGKPAQFMLNNKRGGMYIVRAEDEKEIVYHISQAFGNPHDAHGH
jgi:hypothetical protein